MKKIPLRNRAGETVAHALVDDDVYDDLMQYRWHLSWGYAVRGYRQQGEGHNERMHRRILGLGLEDGQQTDHKNRNKLDNRRENLRVVDSSTNGDNRTCGWAKSGIRGVHWQKARGGKDGGKWVARIAIKGHMHTNGHYDTVEAAAAAVAELRERLGLPALTVPH